MHYKVSKHLLLFFSISIYLAFYSCSTKDTCLPSPDISNISLSLEIERLDKKLFKIHTRTELKELLDDNFAFSEIFLARSQYPYDSIFINRFYDLLHNPAIDTLWKETESVYGDLENISIQFENSFKRIKYYYPEFKPPKIQFVFTGLSHDMYVSDSLIIIGLDYYLGNEASYRPVDIPDYILKRYRKENIVPNSLLLLSQNYNKIDIRDKTLLGEMIFYGKAFYFSKQMLPCVPDSIFLGYSPKEMEDIFHGQEIIWANFIENEVLFDTNHHIKDKFIAERPKTFEIGQNCPGRIGRWIGWEIVKDYMDNNKEATLPDLMKNNNSRIIFEKSGFKPRRQDI
jgi:gliding motility-associated lipoprotein GldB